MCSLIQKFNLSIGIPKKCKKCGIVKPLSEFSKRWNGRDGLQSYCKQCNRYYQNQWRKVHPDYFEKWRKEHSTYSERWHKNHPNYFKRYCKQWRKVHPDYFKNRRKVESGA